MNIAQPVSNSWAFCYVLSGTCWQLYHIRHDYRTFITTTIARDLTTTFSSYLRLDFDYAAPGVFAVESQLLPPFYGRRYALRRNDVGVVLALMSVWLPASSAPLHLRQVSLVPLSLTKWYKFTPSTYSARHFPLEHFPLLDNLRSHLTRCGAFPASTTTIRQSTVQYKVVYR